MKINNIKNKVLKLSSFNKKNYEKLDIDSLVLFGMFLLEKKGIPLYFDYIAVSLFKLFPNKFSMANFKKYPDTYRINNSVRRLAGSLKKFKGVTWATGSVEKGFNLTDTGREIAIQVENFLKNPERQKKRDLIATTERSRGRSLKDDVEEIEKSLMFQKWARKDYKINDYEVLSSLNAMPYTPKELMFKYLKQLKQSANTIKNQRVLKFLNWLEKKFYHIFH